LTVLEISKQKAMGPSEAQLMREGRARELRFGKPFFEEKRGLGKVTKFNPPHGVLRCAEPSEDYYFHIDDVPSDFLQANDGKVDVGADVEFEYAGKYRGMKRAKNLRFSVVQSFYELGLKPEVVQGAASALGLDPRDNAEGPDLIIPAPVQSEAIPKVLGGDDVVIAAETGSGKSLAYMLPLVQRVRELSEERSLDYGLAFRSGSPLGLVICPTRELAMQAERTLKLICYHAKLRVRCVYGGSLTWKKQHKSITGIVDILVATPDRLKKFHDAKDIWFKDIAHVCIDEADFLLTQGFADLQEILKAVTAESRHRKNLRHTLITASITKPLWKIFQEDKRWRHMRVLESRSLHRPQANCTHSMLLTKGRDTMKMLTQLLQPELTGRVSTRSTVVFCNTIGCCKAVGFKLKQAFADRAPRIGCLHKEMLTAERNEVLQMFSKGDLDVLVCTDIAQRGLDLPSCAHVVNFDFPLNSIDYLHRAGRTARYGEPGKVTSLVKKGNKYLAKAIERSLQLGKPINDLSADRRDYLRGGALGHLMEHHPRASKYLTAEQRKLPERKEYAGGLR